MTRALIIISAFLAATPWSRAQPVSTHFPVGTYHQNNHRINGISAGFFTPLNKYNYTNGIKIEMPGVGLLLLLAPSSPISTDPEAYRSVMSQPPKSIVNGICLSALGTFCDGVTNGLSLGYAAQLNRTVNGLSAALAINYAEKHNGLQAAVIFSSVYTLNGVQLSSQNRAVHAKGLQAGIVNVSKRHAGVQLGIYNKAQYHKGLQIGCWNVNQKRRLPLINWHL